MKSKKEIQIRKEDLEKALELNQKGMVIIGNTTRIRMMRELDILEWVLK